MPREKTAPTWLNPFAGLIGPARTAPPRAFRRLRGEWLEDRMVLSTASVDAPQDQSLADYLTEAHPLGPTLPADVAPAADAPAPDAQPMAAMLSPVSIDQLFGAGQGEGEGGGSGSGSGGGSGSGSGGMAGSGSGSGEGEGSGSGSGSGSGGGSSSGSSGGDPEITDPVIVDSSGDIIVTGYITDDGGLDTLTMTLDGGTGAITINDDGTFTVNITDTQGNNTFTINATDADGNTTSFTFTYNTT